MARGRLAEAAAALRKYPEGFSGTKAAAAAAEKRSDLERRLDQVLREGGEAAARLTHSGDFDGAARKIEELRAAVTCLKGEKQDFLDPRHRRALEDLSKGLEERRGMAKAPKEALEPAPKKPEEKTAAEPEPATPRVSALKAVSLDAKILKPGLAAECHAGRDFDSPLLRRVDPRVSFDWKAGPGWAGGPSDGFSIRWWGYLLVPEAGPCSFELFADDGTVLCLDGLRILDDWRDGPARRISRSVTLEKGYHKILLEHSEREGEARIDLCWRKGDGLPAVIDSGCLFHGPEAPAPTSQTRSYPEMPADPAGDPDAPIKAAAVQPGLLKPGLVAETYSGPHFQALVSRRIEPCIALDPADTSSSWVSADINTGVAGTTAPAGAGGFTIQGSGVDIWETADGFRFVYRRLSGDFDLRACVASVSRTDPWAKAGVMVRQSTDPGAMHATMVVTPESGFAFQRRTSSGAISLSTGGGNASFPHSWVRLVRAGQKVTGFVARDAAGSAWQEVESVMFSGRDPVLAGMCVSSHNNGVLCSAQFRGVSLAGPALKSVSAGETSARWEGYLNVRRGGEHAFEVEAENGFTLFVGGRPCLDAWPAGPRRRHRAACFLEQGLHRIVLESMKMEGGAQIGLFFREGQGPIRPLDPASLFHDPTGFKAAGAPVAAARPAAAPTPVPPGARVPEPPAADQKKAEKVVRDLFKEDYAKRTQGELRSLASRLIKDAAQSHDDAATKFVLLREARDLAAQAGALDLAFLALTLMEEGFAGDAKSWRLATIAAVSKALPENACKALTNECLRIADQFVREDDFDSASRALGTAEAAAKKANEASLMNAVKGRQKETQDYQKEYFQVKGSLKTLAEKPEDPAANLAAGRFRCFVKGDWDGGLPLLAKGPDAVLKAAAEKDLAGAADAEGKAGVGDAWWDFSEKQNPSIRKGGRDRALHWYKLGWKDLKGLKKEKVRGRFKAVMAKGPPTAEGASFRGIDGWRCNREAPSQIALDRLYAHEGQFSLRLSAGPQEAWVRTDFRPVGAVQEYVATAWVLTEFNEGGEFSIVFWKGNNGETTCGPPLPSDQPWWTPIRVKGFCPAGTEFVNVHIGILVKEGKVWVDDVSLRLVGGALELADNRSFED